MAAKTVPELFVEKLRDMYDAESNSRALPKMSKALESEDFVQLY